LALLRIVAPSLYLIEMLLHWRQIGCMYTDAGMCPRASVVEAIGEGWSVYLLTGDLSGVQIVYLCHVVAVLCLIVGFRTRWASLACYVFAYSLQNRFPALPGWEAEIRVLFLIGFFLPWGEWFSVDSRCKVGDESRPTFSVSAATLAWRMQVVVLYLTSGLDKGGVGWADGTAAEVSLASDGYSTPFSLFVLAHCQHYPQSLLIMNYAVPLVEILAPLILMTPWPRLQMVGVMALWCMHTGFGLCLDIGMFSQICCGCLVGFLPGEFWSLLDRWRSGRVPARGTEVMGGSLSALSSAFLIWVCLSISVSALEGLPEFQSFVPPAARIPWRVLGLEQHWNMFVPPPFEGGWHVIKGKTLGGEWVDLMRDSREVSEDPPERIRSLYPDVRVYLFLVVHLRSPDPNEKMLHEAIANYYRLLWEQRHPGNADRLSEIQVAFYRRVYIPGKGFGEVERILIDTEKY
jgi:hypothetical protein